MSKELEFHFTMGPVQAFVAQARRTRDFWAGSFLLSYLSGVAMIAAESYGATILFPKPDEQFLDAIRGKNSSQFLPSQGSIPNRFSAKVDATFKGDKVVDAVMSAWEEMAALVWEADLKSVSTPETQAVWDVQVKNFWEITWVITGDETGASADDMPKNSLALDLRKNMRTQYPPEQAGHKCALMAGWQELSGSLKPGKTQVIQFWQGVKSVIRQNDIRSDEPLCAMAFIKRRFCYYFPKLKFECNGQQLYGWEVPVSVPSVALMAAAPEIAYIGNQLINTVLQEFASFEEKWQAAGGRYGERLSLPKALQPIQKNLREGAQNYQLYLDGNAWHSLVYESPRTYELKPEKCSQAKAALAALYDAMGVRPPSPFYAVVMMDGDSLGKQMADSRKQESISLALKDFTSSVKGFVDESMGYLIYAGGDDVLAILPVDTAIQCTIRIRDSYMACFEEINGKRAEDPRESYREEISTSISAAIIFTHFKSPLSKILHAAHVVLDSEAKEGAGRDALAIRVEKPSGRALDWAQPWAHALVKVKDDQKELAITAQFTKTIFGSTAEVEASNRFIHKLRDRLAALVGDADEFQESDLLLLRHVVSADLKQSNIGQNLSVTEVQKAVDALLHQCIPHRRKTDTRRNEPKGPPKIDGALMALFLASKGMNLADEV